MPQPRVIQIQNKNCNLEQCNLKIGCGTTVGNLVCQIILLNWQFCLGDTETENIIEEDDSSVHKGPEGDTAAIGDQHISDMAQNDPDEDLDVKKKYRYIEINVKLLECW